MLFLLFSLFRDVFYLEMSINHSASFRCLPSIPLHSITTISSLAEFAFVMSTFRTLLKKRLWQGYSFVLFVLCISFFFHRPFPCISIYDTRTLSLYFIRPSMLRKYLKNESIGRSAQYIRNYTHLSKLNELFHLNRAIKVTFFAEYPHRRKIFTSSSVVYPFSPSIFLLHHSAAAGLNQTRYPSTRVISKRCVPIQPPGLIKSNFCYWPTVKCL